MTVADTLATWAASGQARELQGDPLGAPHGTDREPDRGTLLLAPRLGHRELLIRAVAARFPTSELYHPFPRPTIDALLREQRTASGVRLLHYTHNGFAAAAGGPQDLFGLDVRLEPGAFRTRARGLRRLGDRLQERLDLRRGIHLRRHA